MNDTVFRDIYRAGGPTAESIIGAIGEIGPGEAYEVIAQSGADSIVVHRGAWDDSIAVILGSQGKGYVIRDEEIHDLDGEALFEYLADLNQPLQIAEWLTPTDGHTMSECAAFCDLMGQPAFAELVRTGMMRVDWGNNGRSIGASSLYTTLHSNGGKPIVKSMLKECSDAMGEIAPDLVGYAVGVRGTGRPLATLAVAGGVSPRQARRWVDLLGDMTPLLRLADNIGIDQARGIASLWIANEGYGPWRTWSMGACDLFNTLDDLGKKVKPSKAIEYAAAHGKPGEADPFSQWAAVLRLEDVLHGRVDDVFPSNLDEKEADLMREARRARDSVVEAYVSSSGNADPFVVRYEELRENEYGDGQYAIVVPRSAADLRREGANQSHCVGSYANAFAAGVSDIYFLRRREHVDASPAHVETWNGHDSLFAAGVDHGLVTIDVRNGKLSQAFYSHNRKADARAIAEERRPTREEEQAWGFIVEWCGRSGIEVGANVSHAIAAPRAEAMRDRDAIVESARKRVRGVMARANRPASRSKAAHPTR